MALFSTTRRIHLDLNTALQTEICMTSDAEQEQSVFLDLIRNLETQYYFLAQGRPALPGLSFLPVARSSLREKDPDWGHFGRSMATGDLLHRDRHALTVFAMTCVYDYPCTGDVYVYQDHVPNL